MAGAVSFGYSVVASIEANAPWQRRYATERPPSVPLYRIRITEFEAMFFDGSPAGALELIEWGRSVAPHIVIRERIEYSGWADREGHLELEIQGNECQAAAGDWLVCVECMDERRLEVETGDSFERRFEPAR